MARGDKPYRVYRGGRVKGRVPLQRRVEPTSRRDGRRRQERPAAPPPVTTPKPRRGWGRPIGIGVLVLVLLVLAWAVASYLMLGRAVGDANQRLGPVALDDQSGLLMTTPTTTLLLGTDHGPGAGREGARRSDSIMLVRTDPDRGRISYLSIPRDLRVDIPGFGPNRINAAFQLGGPTLTMRTVRALTGLQPNHVVMVDFADFRSVIDALGGVEVDVPKPILSNRFDCPYPTEARCQQWEGWRFERGKQTMSGQRALVYSRVRENRLDPADNDLTRGERQQAVVEAMTDKLVGPGTFLKLPFIGADLAKPLTTDLSAGQLLQLGWVRFRANADRALHCRLGGESAIVGGESVLIGSEENTSTLAMFTGQSAPQPPRPETTFGAGCRVGSGV
jgi:polyisoprenyl-teichoic acid--peptidoglycan teichoic acid transferase